MQVFLRRLFGCRRASKRQSSQQAGGSDVYEATTAPIDDETKVMLKDSDQHEMKVTVFTRNKTRFLQFL